jgi:propanol-preferring alcohol dehydrogenase
MGGTAKNPLVGARTSRAAAAKGSGMRAFQLTRWRGGAELREVSDPEPGPGEVLVRVGGSGACHTDLQLMDEVEPGQLSYELPFTLGHENAGWIEATGAGVSGLEPGQPVAVYGAWGCGRCYRCQQGAENYCERREELRGTSGGLGRDGGMARLMVVPAARYLVALGGLDPADAAPLTDAALTPYHAIKRSLDLLVPGSHAVVIGAGGGLGHMAVQILGALSPARIIAVDQRTTGLAMARDLGADAALQTGEQTAEELRELTKGRGAELVVDLVGSDATMSLAAAASRPLGHVTVVGLGGGVLVFSFVGLPHEAALATTFWGTLPELAEVIALAERGAIRPLVQRFPLDRAAEAYDALRAGTLEGRAVIVPA